MVGLDVVNAEVELDVVELGATIVESDEAMVKLDVDIVGSADPLPSKSGGG